MLQVDETVELVSRLRKGGDEAAATLLVERYGQRLLATAILLCGNESEAQDLMIQTLQSALQSIKKFKGQSSLSTWLHGILLNLSRKLWRRRVREPVIFTDTLPEAKAEGESVGSGMDRELMAARVAAGVRRLTPVLHEVIILRYYEDMQLGEIAETLGISLGTVKSRLFAANAKLREFLPEEIVEYMEF